MHFTSTKSLELPHYLYRSLLRTTEKTQSKNQDHYPSLFHHGLFKLIVLHHLSAINMTWEAFMERVAIIPTTSPPVMHITPSPSLSAQSMEVGSSSMKTQISKDPRVFEFTHTYEKGEKHVFATKSITSVLTLGTILEQREMEEQPLMHHDEITLHQHSKPAPLEVELEDQVDIK